MSRQVSKSLVIILLCCVQTLFADESCGVWQTYKDEKCFKLFDALQSYDDAVNICKQYNSTLAKISSPGEQHFIENYLFKENKIVDYVWIGMKWDKDLAVNYTNWSEGSPRNKSEFCVQLISDENNGKEVFKGKWSDVLCAKRNLVLCEKMPTKTLHQLEHIILSSKILLEKINKQFDYFFSNKWVHFKTFTENNERKALIYPVKSDWPVSRSKAVEICAQNNATLVDIESEEKQAISQSFLVLIPLPESQYWDVCYWLGGYSYSSVADNYQKKYKWLNSGSKFNYTNWPKYYYGFSDSSYPYTGIQAFGSDSDKRGKWYAKSSQDSCKVFCEITFNF